MLAVRLIPAAVSRLWAMAFPGERRAHARQYAPTQQLTLKIEGRRCVTVDWSLGGAKLERYHRPLQRGDLLEGRIGGIRGVKGEFVANVVRVDEDGEVGLQWREMTTSTFVALSSVTRY